MNNMNSMNNNNKFRRNNFNNGNLNNNRNMNVNRNRGNNFEHISIYNTYNNTFNNYKMNNHKNNSNNNNQTYNYTSPYGFRRTVNDNEKKTLDKGGVLEQEIIFEEDGKMHLFFEKNFGTEPHEHLEVDFFDLIL